ncbi:hypothetical protein PanWU01x14_354150, partial [Parasponia andersonii]
MCFDQLGCIDLGGLIRDHNGQVKVAFSQKLMDTFKPIFVELLAIREGLRIAKENCLVIHITESDCSSAASMVNSSGGWSPTNPIANDIVSLLRELGG